ncbi:MAG: class IV adenylate cyclase [Candidatus Komeilibacteria bacterium]
MQLEIEMKAKIKNKKRLLNKFALLGIHNKNKKHFVDIYFSPKNGKRFISFKSPRLRVRKDLTSGTASFEYHLPSGIYGGRESEVQISDGDMMDVILKHLDFIEEVRVDKVRSYYEYRHFNIFIDEVKDLGSFIEVEIMNAANRKTATKQIKQLMGDLGVRRDIIQDWYWRMMLKKKKLI